MMQCIKNFVKSKPKEFWIKEANNLEPPPKKKCKKQYSSLLNMLNYFDFKNAEKIPRVLDMILI